MLIDTKFFDVEEIEIPELSSDDYCENPDYLRFLIKWEQPMHNDMSEALYADFLDDHYHFCSKWLKANKHEDEWRVGGE